MQTPVARQKRAKGVAFLALSQVKKMQPLNATSRYRQSFILATLKLASIRKWRGGVVTSFFLAARGNRQTGFEKNTSIKYID